jgi:hypothetical protein
MGSMPIGDMPQMSASAYVSNTYSGLADNIFIPTHTTAVGPGANQFIGLGNQNAQNALSPAKQDYVARALNLQQQQQPKEVKMADPKRRLVKVVIVDPDDKVPLDKCILYSGEEKLTDLTDQELFFEIEIKTILDKHNAERIKIIDKTVKERKEHLEPVKVRDLRMVVVTVASF